jgi:hypothetical protein
MSYATLQTDIAAWLHRGDLSSVIPSFIANAEARFNRKLRVRQQETAFPAVALVDAAAPLPADFAEFKALWVDGNPPHDLKVATSEYVRTQYDSGSRPVAYAIEGSNVICWPGGGTIKGVYYAKIPALSNAATTNWLLDEASDLYLAEALSYACMYIKNPQRAAEFRGEADRIIAELISQSRAQTISGGALTVRAR